MRKAVCLSLLAALSFSVRASEITIKVKNRYLNIPISHQVDRKKLTFVSKGMDDLSVVARMAEDEPDYWVFKDMTAYRGKTLVLTYDGPQKALDKIYQADTINGQKQMYHEKYRPQFHFTTRRGWINDPNGLVYHNGVYHLYYQHNPFEREWENMTWGHATSQDLVHWTEQPTVLHPDRLGTMFSGSAVFDAENTSGFGTKKNPPLVYAYTTDNPERQVQCIAYSLDGGMTLTKYEGNPVIDTRDKWHSHDTRDPRLFWYAPGKHWVLVLNERDGHSIYNSTNLREWTYQSHVTGFWECPDLFELPVDGDKTNTRWVMYGASNSYMIGRFDGKVFVPESGKHYFTAGTIYAAQTFNHVPDGRRIQIGWGRQGHPGMPFNGMMLLPTELKLKTTKDGIRLVSQPVAEVKQLMHNRMETKVALSANDANQMLRGLELEGGVHLRATLHNSHRTSSGISVGGQNVVDWDSNFDMVNGKFYSPQDPTSMELTADIYVDRTNVEVFIDNGLFSYSVERNLNHNPSDISFWGNNVQVKNISVDIIDSIWK